MKKHIPNIVTCLNLLSGVCACIAALRGRPDSALLFIIAGGVFDFLDGFCARLLGAYSNIGKELDSLADVVSFGVAPSLMLYVWCSTLFPDTISFLTYIPLLIAPFSAFRLAKFNVDERQTTSFLGLPTPACALFAGSITAFAYTHPTGVAASVMSTAWVVPLCSLALCILLIGELPMFSMKFKSLRFSENTVRFIFLIASVLITVTGLMAGADWRLLLFFIFALYILICLSLCLVGSFRRKRQ